MWLMLQADLAAKRQLLGDYTYLARPLSLSSMCVDDEGLSNHNRSDTEQPVTKHIASLPGRVGVR